MKNTERQTKLDKLKYVESENAKKDLSGSMNYCDFCNSQTNAGCNATQEERVADSLCAKAYNKRILFPYYSKKNEH